MPLYNWVPQSQGSSNLIIYRVNDADYVIPANADLVLSIGQTATRTFTLPSGASVFNGKQVTIRDTVGSAWFGSPIVVQRSGSDLINGQSRAFLDLPYGQLTFTWDAATGWTFAPLNVPTPDGVWMADSLAFSNASTGLGPYNIAHSVTGASSAAAFSGAAGGPCTSLTLANASGVLAVISSNSNSQSNGFLPGNGTWYGEILVSLDSLITGATGRFLVGMCSPVQSGSSSSASKPQNGAYIMHDRAVGSNWLICSANNSPNGGSSTNRTEQDSGVLVATSNYHRLAFKINGTGSVNFALNRQNLGTLTTNIASGSNRFLPVHIAAVRDGSNTGASPFSFNAYSFRALFVPSSPRYS